MVPRPDPNDIGSFGEAVYSNIIKPAPQIAIDDANWGYPLLLLCGAIGQMFQDYDYLAHSDPPWSAMLSIDDIPGIGLPWLAQFYGVNLFPSTKPLANVVIGKQVSTGLWSADAPTSYRDVSRFIIPQDCSVQAITYYCRNTGTGTLQARPIIYTDVADAPGTLISFGNTVTIGPMTEQWLTFPFLSRDRVREGQVVWVGLHIGNFSGTTHFNYKYETGTLGPATPGALTVGAGGASNFLLSSGPYQLNVTAVANKLRGYFASGGSSNARAAVYRGDSSGPTTLVATTLPPTIGAMAAGWVDFPFASPVTLTPDNYWLGYWLGSNSLTLNYDSVVAAERDMVIAYSPTGDAPSVFTPGSPHDSKYTIQLPAVIGRSGYNTALADTFGNGPDTAFGAFTNNDYDVSAYLNLYIGEQPDYDDQRQQIRRHDGWNRGTLDAIRRQIQKFLVGTKTVEIIERDTDAYHFTFYIYSDEMMPDYSYNNLWIDFNTYQEFYDTYVTYDDFWQTIASVQMDNAVKLVVPAGVRYDKSIIPGSPSTVQWSYLKVYLNKIDYQQIYMQFQTYGYLYVNG